MVYQYFVRLNKLGVIKYIPGKKTALLIFLEERLPDKSIYISPENYLHRKERYEKRLNAMLHYSTSMDTCRSVLLLKYFGQDEAKDCDNCDYCRSKNVTLNAEKLAESKREVLRHLTTKTMLPDELHETIRIDPSYLSLSVRILLDEEAIRYNENGQLEIFKAK
jgi:ATP-dependent DNA helicase RecQ